jgi:REP element-mobilizing transposase RayT
MSQHTFSRCWIHFSWGTYQRQRIINFENRLKINAFFDAYSKEKMIYLKSSYVNSDHVHLLIDLPTRFSIEEAAHLYKGSSSYWINQNKLITGGFTWARGYGAFSVSQSSLDKVVNYILNQEDHHKRKTYQDEYEEFIKSYGISQTNEDTGKSGNINPGL